MSRSLPLSVGVSYSGFTVLSPASTVSGHAYWNTTCNLCGASRVVRGNHLRTGKATCSCQEKTSFQAVSGTLDPATLRSVHSRVDGLETDLQPLIEDLAYANSRIDSLLAALETLPGGAPASGPADDSITVRSIQASIRLMQTSIAEIHERFESKHDIEQLRKEFDKKLDKLAVSINPLLGITDRKLGYMTLDAAELLTARQKNLAAMKALIKSGTDKAEYKLRYGIESESILLDFDKDSKQARQDALAELEAAASGREWR